MPEREVEARVEWFLTTGDVRQWSGPDEQNPFPLMQEDFAAYLASAESRLLAAEARVREVEMMLADGQQAVLDFFARKNDSLKEQNATLRAEREALAHHILRYGWHEAECPFIHDTLPCHCGFEAIETQARAILAREVGA